MARRIDSTTERDPDAPLLLGQPDTAAALAPARRFEAREATPVKAGRYGVLGLFGAAIGTYLGKLHEEAERPLADEAAAKAPGRVGFEGTAAPDQGYADAGIDVVQQVADYLRQLQTAEIDDTPAMKPRRHSPIRLDFGESDAIVPSVSFGRSGNDNTLGARIFGTPGDDLFSFPPLRLPDLAAAALTPGEKIAPGGTPGVPSLGLTEDGGPSGNGNGNGSGGNGNPGPTGPTTPANRLPVVNGRALLGSGLMNLSALILLSDFARAATDADGDPLTISQITATSGSVRVYGDGVWLYTPERNQLGTVTFSYRIGDGKGTVAATGSFNLVKGPATTLAGTPGDDLLLGTPGDDVIAAGSGDDIVHAREGNDHVEGGEGDDILIGGEGDDRLDGGAGHDRIFGGAGNDLIFGGDGDDLLAGEAGDDVILAGAGHDIVSGGAGNDRLFGEDGDDRLAGNAGADLIDGGAGHDRIAGGSGDDVIFGGTGDDLFLAGLDLMLDMAIATALGVSPEEAQTTGDGDDILHGEEGNDTYDASAARQSVTIDLDQGTAEGAEIGHDRLFDIENATGGAGDDTLMASNVVNIMTGGAGQDVFVFRSVQSLSNSGRGSDVITDFAVGDRIDLSQLAETLGGFRFLGEGEVPDDLSRDEQKALIKLYKRLADDGDDDGPDDDHGSVIRIITDLDGDDDLELVVLGHDDLDEDDFILALTSSHQTSHTA